MSNNDNPQPTGELTIQTIAMPADTNANGDIFGGWLVSQMDLAAGITAKHRTPGRVVTVAIDSIIFHKPVNVGDIVGCYSKLVTTGRTSMTIDISVWTVTAITHVQQLVAQGRFIYVAIDESGRPRPVAPI
jgi:acyl-CoA thioesterase YciA